MLLVVGLSIRDLNNNGASALSGLIVGAIYKGKAKNEQERLNKLLLVFKNQLEQVIAKENVLLKEIEAANLKKDQISSILEQSNKVNLERLYADVLKKKEDVKNNITNTYSNTSKNAFSNFTNSLNYALQSQKISSAVTAGDGLDAINAPVNSDVCNQQANAAWKKSPEYIAYANTKTNANASLCKAKLIDLTIQYCGSKIPAAELKALKEASKKEKQTAAQLKAATPKFSAH
jgi:hypothetical protein